jgi:hypothetical protein
MVERDRCVVDAGIARGLHTPVHPCASAPVRADVRPAALPEESGPLTVLSTLDHGVFGWASRAFTRCSSYQATRSSSYYDPGVTG